MRQPASWAILWETNADGIELADTLPLGVPAKPDIIGDWSRQPHKIADMVGNWIMWISCCHNHVKQMRLTWEMWLCRWRINEDHKLATRKNLESRKQAPTAQAHHVQW